jgi:hypothetical protein
MSKGPILALCAVISVFFLASPILAGNAPETGLSLSKVSKFGGQVSDGGKAYLVNTEAHLTGCLRNVFGLFNPCLDMIKGCTSLVLYPIEKPISMISHSFSKPKPGPGKQRAHEVPAPEKPTLPVK